MPKKRPARPPHYFEWGANIRQRRLEIEPTMTQAMLAKRLGVHQTAVSQWEVGLTAPGTEMQARLCRALDRRQSVLFPLPKLRSLPQRHAQ